MGISNWSTTPASNNSSPPNGAPEGMAPSSVNDIFRQQMADHKTQWLDAQWFNNGDAGLSYASASSFKIAGDMTGKYQVGRRVKCYDATTLYGAVASSSYSAPDTTITVTLDSGNLSNSLSSVALSILTPNSSALPVYTSLSTGGASSLSGAVTMKSTLSVEGATTLSGATTIKGAVTLEAATVLKGALSVEGSTTLSGTTTIKGAATLESATTLKLSLNVEGATTLSGATTIKGIATLESATIVKNNLTVQGTTTLSGAVVCSSTLTVNGVPVTGTNDWTKIESKTASSSSSITFTDLSSQYIMYVVVITDVQPATDGTSFLLRTSSNNGSSYDSGAANYLYANLGYLSIGSEVHTDSTGSTYILLGSSLSSASNRLCNGVVYLYNPSSATKFYTSHQMSHTTSAPYFRITYGGGIRDSAAAVNAVQFLMLSGNIASGTFTLYGVKA